MGVRSVVPRGGDGDSPPEDGSSVMGIFTHSEQFVRAFGERKSRERIVNGVKTSSMKDVGIDTV